MSKIGLEEQIAVALAYGDSGSMAAMGAAQSKDIQRLQTGSANAALWASFLVSLGRKLIAYKSATLIAEKPDARADIRAVMDREHRGAVVELGRQIKHVLKHKKRGRSLSEIERNLVAAAAIDEWTRDYCRVCLGAGEVPMFESIEGQQPTQICTTCEGNLRHKYDDREREDAILEKANLFGIAKPKTTHHLVKAVFTARAVIRLSVRTTLVEYARIYGR